MRIPDHLPRKLTISLWDFSWYTMTRPGEPYCDLASRFDELVERGYNTIRTCAMPFFLFDEQGRRPGPLRFSSLGEIGRRTRWYNCQGEPSWTGMRICWSCSDKLKPMAAT